MMTLEQACERILGVIPPPRSEVVSLAEANERFLFANIDAPIDLPPFDNSAMDGYAVISGDVGTASAAAPVRLRVRDRIPAGTSPAAPVTPGTCARVFTGSPMPAGADAVVMQEDTQADPAHPDQLMVLDSIKPWENIRLRGEDIRQGTRAAAAGTPLSPGLIALLTALGIREASVARQPMVGLLATGN